ncbi:ABC transporter ATP-binding protein [Levilactobacillus cerevisiae]
MRHYLGQHRLAVSIEMGLLILIEGLVVYGSVLNADILNALIKGERGLFLFKIGLLMVTWIGIAAVNYVSAVYQERVIQDIDISIRQDLADILTQKDYEAYNSRATGVYESWVNNDIQTINTQGLQNYFTVVQGIFGTIFALITLIAYHWSLALTALGLAGLIILAPKIFDKRVLQANQQLTHANEAFVDQTQGVLGVFNLLYAFRSLKLLKQEIVAASQSLKQVNVNRMRAQSSVMVVGLLGNVISQVVLLGMSGVLAIFKIVSIGTLSAVGSLSGNIFNNLGSMSNYLGMIRGVAPIFAKFTLERQSLSNSDPHQSRVIAPAPTLTVQDLSYGYQPDQAVFQHVTYQFAAGKKYLILGASGSGKSTFLKVLGGYLTNYTGKITIAGQSMRALSVSQLRTRILYLDQSPQALATTVRRNLVLTNDYSDDELIQVLLATKLCISERTGRKFLDKNVGEGGRNLSGGQLQRLALARGLLRHVPVILLDEGTSAVDAGNAVKIERLLLTNPTLTLIMISHTPHEATAGLFDEVIQFEDWLT